MRWGFGENDPGVDGNVRRERWCVGRKGCCGRSLAKRNMSKPELSENGNTLARNYFRFSYKIYRESETPAVGHGDRQGHLFEASDFLADGIPIELSRMPWRAVLPDYG